MELETQVQILDKAVGIPFYTNALVKSINPSPSLLPLSMDK